MIISSLKGGLGNQLFQYAVGRALAEKHNTELKLDTSWYGVVPDRQYDLDHFNITGAIAKLEEVEAVRGGTLDKVLNLIRPYENQTYIKERFFIFDPEVLKAGPNVYLDGYWQSEKYFKDIAPIIRQEFTLKAKPTGKNEEFMKSITSTTAVSLHVRRGDYVANKKFNSYHGTCSIEYYETAVAKIAEKVKKPHFFIFSDDPAWTKENLKFDYPMTFVTGNDKAAQEDLRLMSHCQHFVVANSTFSWWGAWLAANQDKMVVAPKEWFRNNANDDKDLVPKDWIRL